jgi:diguanylate cyclase (GGDEF)-like protein
MLHDRLGHRIGQAVLFHPAESLDALPHGEAAESESIEASQEDVTERLEQLCKDFSEGGLPFGVLWVSIDQAHDLRRTHGFGACEAMFKKLERALAPGLRPAEYLGRWGEDEFLVISHERTWAMLANHAQTLAGLARTADFRWWGDRISLTVSIGAAQAAMHQPLVRLLERAEAAMIGSRHAGGNHITSAPEEKECSPS